MLDADSALIIAAHPDDEVLGCGGTMARLAQKGCAVYVAILGEGITSRFAEREEADPAQLAALHDRSRQAADLLGVQRLFQLDLPDNRFDTVPLLDVVKKIEELVEMLRPEIVFTQHGGDLNVDHNIVYRATLTATRPMAGCPVRSVYSYEVASSSEWAFSKFAPVFKPTVFADISATLDQKIAAMATYESEARPFPHPRSGRALRAIAERWGSTAGLEAAEAFELVRAIH